jgi:hypothetical protein
VNYLGTIWRMDINFQPGRASVKPDQSFYNSLNVPCYNA